MTPLAQFVVLLAAHWLGDFVLQTHWQASNKSKSNDALGRHVLSYTLVLGFASAMIFPIGSTALVFTAVNGTLHFWTDYFTSRWSSQFFGSAAGKVYSDDGRVIWTYFDPHNFFVVVGFDQFVHQATLAATLWVAVTYGGL